MEVMTSPDYPWEVLYHRIYHLPQETNSSFSSNQDTIETNDFISSGHVDWFKNPILAPNEFEEGNIVNISPTIKTDISCTLGVIVNISIGESYSLIELADLKHLFQ